MTNEPMEHVEVQSIYGHDTLLPYVIIRWGDRRPHQFSPEKAREIALMLLEAAEAGKADAFIFEFFKKNIGEGDDKVGAIGIRLFREWRLERSKS